MVRLSKAATRPLLWGDGTVGGGVLGLDGFRGLANHADAGRGSDRDGDDRRSGGPGLWGVVAESPDWLPIDIRTCRRSSGRPGWCGASGRGGAGTRCPRSR
jgi:hypothetical protein